MNDQNKRTGRTTGLILQALGLAVLKCGAEIEFFDHFPHTHHWAHLLRFQIKDMIEKLGLHMNVRRDGARVFIQSCIPQHAKKEGEITGSKTAEKEPL